MKRIVWISLCCMLAMVLLAGCDGAGTLTGTTPTVTPGPPGSDYAQIVFSMNHESFTNAEGRELHWESETSFDLEGNMGYFDRVLFIFPPEGWITVPYSGSFTVKTWDRPYEGHFFDFTAYFYKDEAVVNMVSVGGDFQGTATLYGNNVVELAADNTDIYVRFKLGDWEEGGSYEIEGSTEHSARLALVDDEIITKGMAGEYTVSKYDDSIISDTWDERLVYRRTYNADGQIILEE